MPDFLSPLWAKALLGAGVALAVLGAITWHRGVEIDELNRKLGDATGKITQRDALITKQNLSIDELRRAGAARAAAADKAIDQAHGQRTAHQQEAYRVISEHNDGSCAAVENEIDQWSARRAK